MDRSEWSELTSRFRENIPDSRLEEDSIIYSSGSSTLEITREGTVRGEMPLHSFKAGSFEKIEFTDSSVTVKTSDSVYEFRGI